MVISPVPNIHPDEVWYRFTADEWHQLPRTVRSRIVSETRATYIGREAVAIFTATYAGRPIPRVSRAVPLMPEPSCTADCTAPVCFNPDCPSNQPGYTPPAQAID